VELFFSKNGRQGRPGRRRHHQARQGEDPVYGPAVGCSILTPMCCSTRWPAIWHGGSPRCSLTTRGASRALGDRQARATRPHRYWAWESA